MKGVGHLTSTYRSDLWGLSKYHGQPNSELSLTWQDPLFLLSLLSLLPAFLPSWTELVFLFCLLLSLARLLCAAVSMCLFVSVCTSASPTCLDGSGMQTRQWVSVCFVSVFLKIINHSALMMYVNHYTEFLCTIWVPNVYVGPVILKLDHILPPNSAIWFTVIPPYVPLPTFIETQLTYNTV